MERVTKSAHLIMALSRLQTKNLKRIDSQLSVHGISFTEFMVMYQLAAAPQNSLRRIELAESIGLSASGVTRLLAPMEKMGLVQKEANARDARVSLVKLTDSGQRLFTEALMSFEQTAEALAKPLEAKQLEQMLILTKKLL